MRLVFCLVTALGLGLLASCSSDAALCADRSASTADRTVFFGGGGGSSTYTYNPACMIIASGQTVTFQGVFFTHPLARGAVGDADAGSPNNPVPEPATNTGTSLAVTYPTTGDYPYFCTQHTAEGMKGSVQAK